LKNPYVFFLVPVASLFAAPCSPNLKEIYHFQVGDIFQHRKAAQCGCGSKSDWEYKRTVLSKRVSGDTLEYRFHVKEIRIETPTQGGLFSKTIYSQYEQTQVLVDTPGSTANRCPGDTVPIFRDDWTEMRGAYSIVQTPIALDQTLSFIPDHLKTKTMGDSLGQVYGMENGKYVPYSPPIGGFQNRIQMTLVETLGVVSWWNWTEGGASTILIGYVRNGDTLGVIWPDSQFGIPTSIRNPHSGTVTDFTSKSLPGVNPDLWNRGRPRFDVSGRRRHFSSQPFTYGQVNGSARDFGSPLGFFADE
jgi:hypothetical protein